MTLQIVRGGRKELETTAPTSVQPERTAPAEAFDAALDTAPSGTVRSGALLTPKKWQWRAGVGGKVRDFWELLTSRDSKRSFATDFVEKRIQAWEKRVFLPRHTLDALRLELARGLRPYALDAASQTLLTAPALGLNLILNAALVSKGILPLKHASLIVLSTGGVIRTIYTLKHYLDSRKTGESHMPWVALGWGILLSPFTGLGNAAFIAEDLVQAKNMTKESARLTRFILADMTSRPFHRFLSPHSTALTRMRNWIG